MAGLSVALLAVLVGTLLLVSAREWEQIDGSELFNLQQQEGWDDAFFSTDDIVEGEATEVATSDLRPFGNHDFGVKYLDAAPTWARAPAPRAPAPSTSGLNFVCSDAGFEITPSVPLSDIKVLGSREVTSVLDAPESCGYNVSPLQNALTVPFTGCHVKQNVDGYSLQLLYINELGQTEVATASCEFELGPSPRSRVSSQPSKCPYRMSAPIMSAPIMPAPIMPAPIMPAPMTPAPATPAPATPAPATPAPATPAPATSPPYGNAQNCDVPMGQRLPCGHPGISTADCEKMGCCVESSACYYPLNECTADKHFVFSIGHDPASIPVDPLKLTIPGYPNCKPVIVDAKVAIFKFKVTECGVHSYKVGNTQIYLAEVQTVVQTLNLKYGFITRSDPLRYLIECRYGKMGSNQQLLASIGYMVQMPSYSSPSVVVGLGRYGVELRIAKDETYSSYFPTYHQPLRLLLGKPVHLELRIKSAKPDAVILVNYCVAYPRSASNALVLIYEGCANPNDPNVSILKVSDLPQNRKQRRFVVKAFQFMDQRTNKYLDEDIYFMCSTEVCRPSEKTCAERCFDGKAR